MFYLIIMLMAEVLGLGRVCLMLVGGFIHMVSSIGLWTFFALNTVLITSFFTASHFCRQELQLLVCSKEYEPSLPLCHRHDHVLPDPRINHAEGPVLANTSYDNPHHCGVCLPLCWAASP